MIMVAFTVAFAAVAARPATVAGQSWNGEKARQALAHHPLKTFAGAETRLSSYRGEVVVVNFWASWCAPCRTELPILNGWHQAWAGRGARVVAISIDKEMRRARGFAEKANLSMTVLHDGPDGLAKTLNLPSLPCTLLLDREGNVVSVVQTSALKDLDALEQKVEFMLAMPKKPAPQAAGMGPSHDHRPSANGELR
jgi:thiol-disulfide isomerase/thioredoxin